MDEVVCASTTTSRNDGGSSSYALDAKRHENILKMEMINEIYVDQERSTYTCKKISSKLAKFLYAIAQNTAVKT